ncbi:MAG TPA: MEDS domain-containing protein [Candidatus Dormibacteraeota bacterium]|jgi:transcriptional repressor of dcmA and dcmR|nr:MEDS domain-containing protein [Candidatus Dormibacteraeota bacterium]
MASHSLLNTKEAAEFLRVSEASIRRWSNAGLLQAQRVGRRRERRFAPDDLRRFLEDPRRDLRPPAPGPLAVNVGGAAVPLRTHLAPIYSSDVGMLRLSVPFLVDGLRAGQPCYLVASGVYLDRYMNALADEGIDVAAAEDRGQLVTTPGPGSDVADAISSWERLFGKALAAGPTVLRVIGEMVCERAVFGSEAAMMAYEEAYELMAKRFPVVTLCQYDAREFDGEIMLRALKSHPDMFEQHMGGFLN